MDNIHTCGCQKFSFCENDIMFKQTLYFDSIFSNFKPNRKKKEKIKYASTFFGILTIVNTLGFLQNLNILLIITIAYHLIKMMCLVYIVILQGHTKNLNRLKPLGGNYLMCVSIMLIHFKQN